MALVVVVLAVAVHGFVSVPPARLPTSLNVAERIAPQSLLSLEEEIRLGRYGSVERQRRRGRVGEAFIVVDSALPPDEIWRNLVDVEGWTRLMRGVRSATVRERRRDGTLRAGFQITKLRLPANIILRAPQAGYVRFQLDNQCTNLAVDGLEGYWHVAPSPNADSLTRVCLAATVSACRIVPNAAIDYVASKALRRATAWLRAPDDDLAV
ncbi:hypothetical protein CTAYLR_006271 [Chrysophaeum taylorii]|uniref:Coenzyme Q-binding protein COQ10 START domain-containing protein n=1 Tax=Chrysophaeum taylorii TaxID=2483200 RepID=A0AAD7XNM2_9STRA|nr:hypothetical protein CTAYLR_006271 [Chrysophaeum taylorii]